MRNVILFDNHEEREVSSQFLACRTREEQRDNLLSRARLRLKDVNEFLADIEAGKQDKDSTPKERSDCKIEMHTCKAFLANMIQELTRSEDA